ncbi:MAG: hypothetical protein EBY41_07035 [Proteobacteria bacterium]|jgi:transposase|nr:hypothetical protein [Pseudomonadota bacterium]
MSKENIIDIDEDFDFGFSLVDESELDAVQQAQQQVQSSSAAQQEVVQQAETTQQRLDKLFNMIMPLLNNLAKNPEKEYIMWPDRVDKIEAFRDRLTKVYKG